MSGGGEQSRGPAKGMDPSTALTVGQAARLAGVSEATLRKRIQSGKLLHEVGRRGGREVQLVRLVDLADVYPALADRDPEPGSDPARSHEPAAGGGRGIDPTAEPAAEPIARALGGPDAVPTAESSAEPHGAPSAEPTIGATAAAAGRREGSRQHAFEVRLASLQVGNDGLGAQVRDLQTQREDLRTQCDDLRTRLTSVERERQAGTAGLLLAQRRLLQLEADGAVVQLGPAWWKRSSSWGLAVVFVLMGGTLGLEIHESRTARAAARENASNMEGRLSDLAGDLEVVQESGSRALEQLASEREGWEAERGAFAQEAANLEQRRIEGRERQDELTAQLQSEFQAAQADRRLLAESLSEARVLTGALREELVREREESRTERARTTELFDEREQAATAERAETSRTLAELRQRAEASTEASEALAGELAQRRIDEQSRTDLLLQELERLGARLPEPGSAVESETGGGGSVSDRDAAEDERARRWLFGLHLPGRVQTSGEGGR